VLPRWRIFVGGIFFYCGFTAGIGGRDFAFAGIPSTSAEPLSLKEMAERSEMFTGWKDRNGAEVFEGDIVEGRKLTRGSKRIGMVKFKSGHFYIDCCGEHLRRLKDMEVIGNRWENPDLEEVANGGV
jgi:hypothetical protein